MPRKTTTADLLAEEAAVVNNSSPLRRSTRNSIASSAVVTPQKSTLAPKPRTRRPSTQDDIVEEKPSETKPTPRGRRASTLVEEQNNTPSARRQSTAKSSNDVRGRRVSTEQQDDSKPKTVRTRRSSANDQKPEAAEEQAPRRTRSVRSETSLDAVDENKGGRTLRSRRTSSVDEKVMVSTNTSSTPKKSTRRRSSVTDNLEPIKESSSIDQEKTSHIPYVVLTPVKKTRAELNLSIINESTADDLHVDMQSPKSEEMRTLRQSPRLRLSLKGNVERIDISSSPKKSPGKIESPLMNNYDKVKEKKSPTKETVVHAKEEDKEGKQIEKSTETEKPLSNISLGSDSSFVFHLNVSVPSSTITSKSQDELNTSNDSNVSNKENVPILSGEVKKAAPVVIKNDHSFFEPMEVDEYEVVDKSTKEEATASRVNISKSSSIGKSNMTIEESFQLCLESTLDENNMSKGNATDQAEKTEDIGDGNEKEGANLTDDKLLVGNKEALVDGQEAASVGETVAQSPNVKPVHIVEADVAVVKSNDDDDEETAVEDMNLDKDDNSLSESENKMEKDSNEEKGSEVPVDDDVQEENIVLVEDLTVESQYEALKSVLKNSPEVSKSTAEEHKEEKRDSLNCLGGNTEKDDVNTSRNSSIVKESKEEGCFEEIPVVCDEVITEHSEEEQMTTLDKEPCNDDDGDDQQEESSLNVSGKTKKPSPKRKSQSPCSVSKVQKLLNAFPIAESHNSRNSTIIDDGINILVHEETENNEKSISATNLNCEEDENVSEATKNSDNESKMNRDGQNIPDEDKVSPKKTTTAEGEENVVNSNHRRSPLEEKSLSPMLPEAETGKQNESISSPHSHKKVSSILMDEFLSKKFAEQTDSSDGEYEPDDVQRNEYIDDMAEEGEEDTPSEDSNQLIDDGESVGSSDAEQIDEDEDYEKDSFVCSDEETELLSGDEYDLDSLKATSDKKTDKCDEKEEPKKRSRIITVSDSSEEEQEEEQCPSLVLIDDVEMNNSTDKLATTTSSQSTVEAINSSLTDTQTTSSKRKSSITILENIRIDDNNTLDTTLSERVNSLVETFCTTVKRGQVSLNLSLEYVDSSQQGDVDGGLDDGQQIKSRNSKSPSIKTTNHRKLSVSAENVRDLREKLNLKRGSTSLESPEGLANKQPSKKKKKNNTVSLAAQRNLSSELDKSKKQKRKKKKGKNKTRDDVVAASDLKKETFSLMNQLITDVKNRPKRTIRPTLTSLDDLDSSWITTKAKNMKPSTSDRPDTAASHKTASFHPKDFRSQILNDPSRVRRTDTKTLLKKRVAYACNYTK